MTTPEPKPPTPVDDEEKYADRAYRSPGGLVAGALLLALVLWLGIDALIGGEGRTPWLALAGLLFAAPLVIAFTLRPAIFANENRMRVRNPFRVITLPWASVAVLRAGYSNEVRTADDRTFQLWSLPVSLRSRKIAQSRNARAERAVAEGRKEAAAVASGGHRASSDRAMDELRELQEKGADLPGSQGEAEIRWAYEIIAPAVAGAVLLAVLWLTG